MKHVYIVGDALVSIRRHKSRSVLTAFGVFWGLLTLMVLIGAGNGFRNGVMRNFEHSAENYIRILGGRTEVAHDGLPPGRAVEINHRDLKEIRERVPGVERLAPENDIQGDFSVLFRNENASMRVSATYPEISYFENLELVQGRWLNPIDLHKRRKVATLSVRAVELLSGRQRLMVGDHLSIKGTMFLMVGIFRDAELVEETPRVHIPFTVGQHLFGMGDRVEKLYASIRAGHNSAAVVTELKSLFGKLHHFSYHDRTALRIYDNNRRVQRYKDLFKGLNIFIWLVGTGVLIAGVVAISNVLVISVNERTQEIGIRRALGESKCAIAVLIVSEALMLTMLGGVLGLTAGLALIGSLSELMMNLGIQSTFFYNPTVEDRVVYSSLIVLLVIGVAAAIIPAKRALDINPSQALSNA